MRRRAQTIGGAQRSPTSKPSAAPKPTPTSTQTTIADQSPRPQNTIGGAQTNADAQNTIGGAQTFDRRPKTPSPAPKAPTTPKVPTAAPTPSAALVGKPCKDDKDCLSTEYCKADVCSARELHQAATKKAAEERKKKETTTTTLATHPRTEGSIADAGAPIGGETLRRRQEGNQGKSGEGGTLGLFKAAGVTGGPDRKESP